MSISIDKLKAAAAAKAAEEKPDEGEEKKDQPGEAAPEAPEAPADPENAPAAPEAPADPENAEGEPDGEPEGEKDEDEDEDEAKKALAAVQALSAKVEAADRRIVALEDGLKAAQAENGRLKGALRDPAFAAAALRPEDISAGGEASAASAMTKAQAEAAYAKLTDARAKADFRREHAEELGLGRR